jgi:chemotaxis protein CheC
VIRRLPVRFAEPLIRDGNCHGNPILVRQAGSSHGDALAALAALLPHAGWSAMTAGCVTPIEELERDALTEISNIAMGRAAVSLGQMIKHQVLLSVPAVEILTNEEAAAIVAQPDNPNLVAVRQDFRGTFSGRAMLIFPEANSLELVRAVVGRELPLEDVIDLEDEALAETGNIILNSWVATVANLLKRSLSMSLPMVMRGDGPRMLQLADPGGGLVLFLYINFEISLRSIRGYLALLMDLPSMEALRELVADFIASTAQAARPEFDP